MKQEPNPLNLIFYKFNIVLEVRHYMLSCYIEKLQYLKSQEEKANK